MAWARIQLRCDLIIPIAEFGVDATPGWRIGFRYFPWGKVPSIVAIYAARSAKSSNGS
jgi:hypothetical protein